MQPSAVYRSDFYRLNLRTPITAVGPLVSGMKTELPFTKGVFGLFTTIPLIMFAVLSPFVRRISDRLGAGKMLLFAMAAILLGVAIRSFARNAGLLDATLLLGAEHRTPQSPCAGIGGVYGVCVSADDYSVGVCESRHRDAAERSARVDPGCVRSISPRSLG